MSDFDARARKAAEAVRRGLDGKVDSDVDRSMRRAQRSPARRAVPGAVAVVALLIGITVALPNGGGNEAPLGGSGNPFQLAGALQPFDDCEAVLDYFKQHSPEQMIKRYEGGGGGPGIAAREDSAVAPSAGMAQDAQENAAPTTTVPFSTTNVQESGVEEPDVVKTDGQRIAVVSNGRVHLLELVAGRPQLRSTISADNVQNIFLEGDKLLAFRNDYSYADGGPASMQDSFRSVGERAQLAVYDVSKLAEPKTLTTMDIDGRVLDARLADGRVRVVTASTPDVDAPSPQYGNNGLTEKSKQDLRAAIAKSTVDEWVPTYTLKDGSGTKLSEGRLVDCDKLARPGEFSGLDTVAVTSFGIEESLKSRSAVGVVAGGQQIYATADSLYVSTTDWSADNSAAETNLHKFDVNKDGSSSYKGSGTVQGSLLNQYSMSELDGVLRVATTKTEQRGWINQRTLTEGLVTTLRQDGNELRQIGQVGGLGKQDNESIKAVRFIGSQAYVVTFRQTDPLYVVDIRDAANPKVVGELKIPGYSGYLHPVGKDLVLGVGQSGGRSDADQRLIGPTPEDSEIAPVPPGQGANGVQFSLFDVSDPANPKRIGVKTYGGGVAGAEFDPKAFLYWQPRNLVIAPTNLYPTSYSSNGQANNGFSGLMLLSVNGNELNEVGRLKYVGTDAYNVTRSFVIGDDVYMLSNSGLQVNNLDTHADVARLAFSSSNGVSSGSGGGSSGSSGSAKEVSPTKPAQ